MLSIDERCRASKLLSDIDHLIVLDDLWTYHLSQDQMSYRTYARELVALCDDMTSALLGIQAELDWAKDVLTPKLQDHNEMSRAIERIRAKVPVSKRSLINANAVTKWVSSSNPDVSASIASACAELKAKRAELLRDGVVPGDIPLETKCLVAGISAGLFLPGAAFLVGAIALSFAVDNCF